MTTETLRVAMDGLKALKKEKEDRLKAALSELLIHRGQDEAAKKVRELGVPKMLYCHYRDLENLHILFEGFPSIRIQGHQLMEKSQILLVWSEGWPDLQSLV